MTQEHPHTAQIAALIDAFVSGADTTMQAANRLEVMLQDRFEDDDYIAEIVIMLACYRPGGGPYLFAEDEVRVRLARVMNYLRKRYG